MPAALSGRAADSPPSLPATHIPVSGATGRSRLSRPSPWRTQPLADADRGQERLSARIGATLDAQIQVLRASMADSVRQAAATLPAQHVRILHWLPGSAGCRTSRHRAAPGRSTPRSARMPGRASGGGGHRVRASPDRTQAPSRIRNRGNRRDQPSLSPAARPGPDRCPLYSSWPDTILAPGRLCSRRQ